MKTETDIQIANLHKKVKCLMQQGMDEDKIIAALKNEDIDTGYAELLIDNVKADIRDHSDFWKLMLMGSFFVVGGILLNYFSYSIAVNANSGFFYLYWGIVVLGIVTLIRGFALYRK